jgi:hypothetical protein
MIIITLGNRAELRLDDLDLLSIAYVEPNGQTSSIISLGRATTKRIEELQKYLSSLKLHAVDE